MEIMITDTGASEAATAADYEFTVNGWIDERRVNQLQTIYTVGEGCFSYRRPPSTGFNSPAQHTDLTMMIMMMMCNIYRQIYGHASVRFGS